MSPIVAPAVKTVGQSVERKIKDAGQHLARGIADVPGIAVEELSKMTEVLDKTTPQLQTLAENVAKKNSP